MRSRRLRLGRVQLYIEPRDIWVGVYVARDAVYVCPLPLVVIRYARLHDPLKCGWVDQETSVSATNHSVVPDA